MANPDDEGGSGGEGERPKLLPLVGLYGGDPREQPKAPPTRKHVLLNLRAMAREAMEHGQLSERWGAVVIGLTEEMVTHRALIAGLARCVPPNLMMPDRTVPPWLIYAGDIMRAQGDFLEAPEGSKARPHIAFTPFPPDDLASAETILVPPDLQQMLDFQARVKAAIAALPTEEDREAAPLGEKLVQWPREASDDKTLEREVPVGVGEGPLVLRTTVAQDLEKAGLVWWTQGKARLTAKGQKAGQLYQQIHDQVMREMAEAAVAAGEGGGEDA